MNTGGSHQFTIHEDSAWDRFAWTSELEARVKAADAVYFGTLGQRSDQSRGAIRRCVEAARDADIPRIVDINLRAPFYDDKLIRESIELASILKFSDDELSEVVTASENQLSDSIEESLRRLRDSGDLDLVIMTRGADGAVLVAADEFVQQPGIPTTVRDTVGAGDSFAAAFLLGLLGGEPYDRILRQACVTASAVCAHAGALPEYQ